uniref:Retrovirus-related Pol polyprotein from transposon TNT 1-94 n=1 Tax=Cannabis sativa TaxID=3483 RepID=A0A803Q1S2_CANSA
MSNSKAVSTLLAQHFKLSATQMQVDDTEKTKMSRVSYASSVGSLMYDMVCTRLDIAFALSMEDLDVINGHVDFDYAGCIDTRKSLTGYVFTMFGTTISWKANLQKVVALSTTEA